MPVTASAHAHTATPTIMVSDPRGLVARAVQFHRRQANDPLETRVTQQRFDAAGRLLGSRDPYLFALAESDEHVPDNLCQIFSLGGVVVSSRSVDAGWRLALQGGAGQIVQRWDGRGSHSVTEYDALLRPVAVRERGREVTEHTLERFTYAGPDAAAHNLCGQLCRHDDPAGTLLLLELGIGGALLKHTRHFLRDSNPPDWPSDVAARNALLEVGDGAITSNAYGPGGEPLSQTDALGNLQAFAYTVAGELKNTRLTLAGNGQAEQVLVSGIHYNPDGQVDLETAGNGVITRKSYDPANGRLTGLSAEKTDGTSLQKLGYTYDAVGNVLSINDAAQSIRYVNNQRIEPIKTFLYDTLYQLIHATGWEAKIGRGGPALPDMQPLPQDPNQIANYTQTYHYDAGGNLLQLEHVGAQAHGRTLTRAHYSNRCLPEKDDRPPTDDELANGFDANGNLCELQAGQSLSWDLRNQLSAVRPVVRKDAQDDCERYIYDGGGQRVRKVHSGQTNARTIVRELRYLPGVEIHTHSGTGEILHVISAPAGHNSVRVLHWTPKRPDGLDNNQVRYSLNDHLGSATMELDQQANLISQEWYYPFGGTSCWAGRNATEAKYKTVRYSGKERDATGLYYYGFRYYAPWLQRWINPDPAGAIDGLNLYRMVRNNPITLHDDDGLSPKGNMARGMMETDGFHRNYRANPTAALEALRIIYLQDNFDPDLIEKALERVKERMTPRSRNPEPSIQAPQANYDLKTFFQIYATNEGSAKINEGMKSKSPITINGSRLIQELNERFSDELQGRSEKDYLVRLKIEANGFSLADTKNVASQLYKGTNTETKTYFSSLNTNNDGIEKLYDARDDKTILHSTAFLSTSTSDDAANTFHGTVQLEIKGFSASVLNAKYRYSGEKERVFSPLANFQVTFVSTIEHPNYTHKVMLQEMRGFTGSSSRLPGK